MPGEQAAPLAALAAVEAGADALGFVFHRESPRCVVLEVVRRIVAQLPPFVVPVGVFVNEDPKVVRDLMDGCGLALAQLHGDESAAYCEALGRPILKGVRLRDRGSLLALAEYKGRARVRGFVVDAFSETLFGGTGQVADWNLAAEAARAGSVLLAGGLTPENRTLARDVLVEEMMAGGFDPNARENSTGGYVAAQQAAIERARERLAPALSEDQLVHFDNFALDMQEQMAMPESETSEEFSAARFLLKPGRDYETAVKSFSPYKETKEIYPEARQAAADLIKRMKEKKKKAFIYVNNRLEGNALKSIAAVLNPE